MSNDNDSGEWDEMDELQPSAEELAEAASLARAMDSGADDGRVDDSILAAASLIAYSEGADELREERANAVLQDVLSAARKPKVQETRPEKEPGRRWWRFLVPLPFAAAAAAAFFVMNTAAPLLPAPSMSLLEAQASAAAGEDGARLDEEMRGYRAELYAALEEGY